MDMKRAESAEVEEDKRVRLRQRQLLYCTTSLIFHSSQMLLKIVFHPWVSFFCQTHMWDPVCSPRGSWFVTNRSLQVGILNIIASKWG